MKSYLRFAAAPLAMGIATLPTQAAAEHGEEHTASHVPCASMIPAGSASALEVPTKASAKEIGCAVAQRISTCSRASANTHMIAA